MKLLRQRFEEALGPEYKQFVDIDTIDGFQVCSRHLQSASGDALETLNP